MVLVQPIANFDEARDFLTDIEDASYGEVDMNYLEKEYAANRLRIIKWVEDQKICGACAYYVIQRANGLLAYVLMIGGKGVHQENFAQFVEMLAKEGVKRIQGMGNEANYRLWKRFGFKHKYHCYERTL